VPFSREDQTARRFVGGHPGYLEEDLMSRPIARRRTFLLAATAALIVAAFAAVPAAQASTLYACVSKSGTAHVFTKKPKKCKSKKEKLVSWNTSGVAGKNGTNGSNGTNGTGGAAGQPQKAFKFSAAQPSGEPNAITLFTSDGITYTFSCKFLLIADVTEIAAIGAAGQSYASGVFGRPEGQETKENDLKSEIKVATLAGGSQAIANTVNAPSNVAKSIEQFGIWTITVEGPTSTTWLHIWSDTAATCHVHGTAITVPN
jgi:hypothetical protein